jgi:hypothetical protein
MALDLPVGVPTTLDVQHRFGLACAMDVRMCSLELVWYGDVPPAQWPDPNQIAVVITER